MIRPSFTLSGNSGISFSLPFGIKTSFTPYDNAANNFSLRPPIGNTRPRNVISPVIARSARTLRPVKADTIANVIVIPAEGPSFGVAPSGR